MDLDLSQWIAVAQDEVNSTKIPKLPSVWGSIEWMLERQRSVHQGCQYFILFFVFLGPHLWHMEVPRLGIESELCSCWPTPQPQQREI